MGRWRSLKPAAGRSTGEAKPRRLKRPTRRPISYVEYLPAAAPYPLFIKLLKVQNRSADNPIDAGSVSTHAISRLRMVDICRPDLFAHMVPATPDDKTCVVLTGSPI